MTVRKLAGLLRLNVICLPDPERTVSGGYAGDLLSWVMGRACPDDAWITIMSNQNIVAVASLSDVSVIILAEDVVPDPGVEALARDKGINICSSELSAFSLCGKLSELL